jgi:hypothetical protein
MLNIILLVLAIAYIAINLVMFGTALAFMSARSELNYLFFGTIILIKEFIIDPWVK